VKKKSLPPDVVDQWPEVFSDIDVKAIPISYIDSMRIIFDDGKIWDINIANEIKKSGLSDVDIEAEISELVSNYEDTIQHIDFRLDVAKVKKDIIKNTKRFLKKPNKK
jgi:hypothetical protein